MSTPTRIPPDFGSRPSSSAAALRVVNGGPSTNSAANINNSLETIPINRPNEYKGELIPNTPLGASATSFILGQFAMFGLLLFLRPSILFGLGEDEEREEWVRRWSYLGFFFASWASFHWGEFAVAAGWNRARCSVDSFLLENGKEYHFAHLTAISEFILTMIFFPNFKRRTYLSYFGISVVILGQALRSIAMIHAASNFSHQVEVRRENGHQLVTNGIYAWFRHPSYTGFYYWSLGTQLVLQNPISFIAYSFALHRFFSRRIAVEERFLILSYGDDYRDYRRTVGIWIPFIRTKA